METLELSSEQSPVIRILPIQQDRTLQIRSSRNIPLRIFNYSNFHIEDEMISTGASGQVFKAEIKGTEKFILKRYKDYNYHDNIVDEDIIKEIAILQFLNMYPQTKTCIIHGITFSSRGMIYLVLEPLQKSLSEIIKQKKTNLPADQLRIIFYQLIQAFYYIHGLGIIHNDIKLPNIMINNGDIRIIDFGLSEYLGVGPCKELVNNYISTNVYLAPDIKTQENFGYIPTNRKTYASDMYSIGVTLIHLIIKRYSKLKVIENNIYEVNEKDGSITEDLTPILSDPTVYGILGYDLLLKIMNPDTHLRWCSIDALQHEYLSEFREYVPIDMSIIEGGFEKIYDIQVHYSKEEFILRQMELQYLEIQHQTFLDLSIPMGQIKDNSVATIAMYYILIDWILDIYLTDMKLSIRGLDTLILTIYYINNNWQSILKRQDIQMQGILSNYIPSCIYNFYVPSIDFYHDLTQQSFPKFTGIQNIINQFLKNNKCKMPIYPVSIHIQYIYLKLIFELNNERVNSSEELIKKLFTDICLYVIFWFIQPIPFTKEVSLWEITIFSANMALSNILEISLRRLNSEPLLNFLTLDDNTFVQMLDYFKRSLATIPKSGQLLILKKYFYENPEFRCKYE